MAKKKEQGYLSAKESRRIAKENRKITNEFEKKRKQSSDGSPPGADHLWLQFYVYKFNATIPHTMIV